MEGDDKALGALLGRLAEHGPSAPDAGRIIARRRRRRRRRAALLAMAAAVGAAAIVLWPERTPPTDRVLVRTDAVVPAEAAPAGPVRRTPPDLSAAILASLPASRRGDLVLRKRDGVVQAAGADPIDLPTLERIDGILAGVAAIDLRIGPDNRPHLRLLLIESPL